jgi:hypothetical protein
MFYLFHIANWIVQIDASNPNDPVRVGASEFCDVGIGYDRATRSVPGAEADLLYTAFVHKLDQLLWPAIFRHQV